MNDNPLILDVGDLPSPVEIMTQKVGLMKEIIDKFPFLKDHIEVEPVYTMEGGKIIGGWKVTVYNHVGDGKYTLKDVVSENLKKLCEKIIKEKYYDLSKLPSPDAPVQKAGGGNVKRTKVSNVGD